MDRVRERSVPGLMSSLRGLGGAVGVAAAVAGLAAYTKISDAISSANAQLKLAVRSQDAFNRGQKEAYKIAQSAGVSYASIGTLYAKSAKAAQSMGLSVEQSMVKSKAASEAITAGIRVSGTSVQAASAGVFQLQQALGSGVLRGEELNSVMENIPAVGDAIAEAMGRSSGALRKMGADGELTSKAVLDALEKAMPKLKAMADSVPLTFSQAFQKVQNSAARLLTGTVEGEFGLAKLIISGAELATTALDFLADNSQAVAFVVGGVLVAAGLKAAASAIAAGAAARSQAAANYALASSALVAAKAQQQQAVSGVAIAARGGALGGAGVAGAAQALSTANTRLAATQAASAAASTSLAAATARATLFGRAVAGAATLGRAALAALGGPIGVFIAAVLTTIFFLGKMALAFQPIKGEAATTSDYIAEAFSQAGTWVKKTADDIWKSMKNSMSDVMKTVRSAAVWLVDAFLGVGRAVAGVASGIGAAFGEALSQAGAGTAALAKDAAAMATGRFGDVGATASVARSAPGAVASAYSSGRASGRADVGGSGEQFISGVEALPGRVRQTISEAAARSGLRAGANRRAQARNAPLAPGNPNTTLPGTEEAEKKSKKPEENKEKKAAEDKKKTFSEILRDAREQTRIAALLSSEQEVQNALAAARLDLERQLTGGEESSLAAEVRRKQAVEANLALSQRTADVVSAASFARKQDLTEEARLLKDTDRAAVLEGELAVEKEVADAKRTGVSLNLKGLEALRRSVVAASLEASAAEKKNNNLRANLSLLEETARFSQQTAALRTQQAQEDARIAGDYGRVATLEAELKVAELLNNAKREGTVLDAGKVENYRRAVTLASAEAEVIRLQSEAKRALEAIADNARRSMQTAVSDGIYAALNGDVKSVGGLFKNIGQILRRQVAESLSAKLFGGQDQAKVDSAKATAAALRITEGAASAVTQATNNIVNALNAGAEAISQAAGAAPAALSSAATSVSSTVPGLEQGTGSWVDILSSTGKPLGDAVTGFLKMLSGGLGSLSKGKGPMGAAGRALDPTSKLGSFLGKMGQAAGIGQAGGSVATMLGSKAQTQIGSTVGGMIGSIWGPIGSAIGGALGSFLEGSLTRVKWGGASVTSSGVTGMGRDAGSRKSSLESGNSVLDKLKGYAKALGGRVEDFGKIEIGQYRGSWKVQADGGKLKKGQDFGGDASAAIEYALKRAVEKGALGGISEGISSAIRSGLSTVEEAIDFTKTKKKISREALSLVDPVRAAVLDLDDEFTTLLEQYKRFGEDTTDLEKVYLDRRQKTIEEALSDQLKGVRDFISEIRGGTVGGASVVDRRAEQNRLFSAIEEAQAAGRAVDYESLNTVGRALLDATRELEGGNPAFYSEVERVMKALEAALASGSNPNVTTLLPTPLSFREEVSVPVVASLESLTAATNDNFAELIAAVNLQSQVMIRGNAALQQTLQDLRTTDPSQMTTDFLTGNFR